jgi:hypothetical protein
MEQLTLDTQDFEGNSLLHDYDHEFDYFDYGIPLEKIHAICFYVDYCSTGIWISVKTENEDFSWDHPITEDLLPFRLHEDFKFKLNALQKAFDAFGDSSMEDETWNANNFFDLAEQQLFNDFKKLHPEYAHLIRKNGILKLKKNREINYETKKTKN